IRDADVQAPEFGLDGGDEPFDRRRVGDVERTRQDANAVLGANGLGHRADASLIARAERQVGTLGGQSLGHGAPQPRAGGRYNRDAVFEAGVHGCDASKAAMAAWWRSVKAMSSRPSSRHCLRNGSISKR